MNVIISAASVVIAIGSIGSGAIYLDNAHVSKVEYNQYVSRSEASQLASALFRMGAVIRPDNRVICTTVPTTQRANCIWLRTRFYNAIKGQR
jgi:hypothetical protein